MAWNKRSKPTTNWAEVQFGGTALTWADAGTRSLTWNDMIRTTWDSLTSTDWTKRTGVSTSWT